MLKCSLAVWLLPLLLIIECPVVKQEVNIVPRSSLRSRESLLSDPSDCASRPKQPQVITNPHNFSVDIQMPGVVPTGVSLFL